MSGIHASGFGVKLVEPATGAAPLWHRLLEGNTGSLVFSCSDVRERGDGG